MSSNETDQAAAVYCDKSSTRRQRLLWGVLPALIAADSICPECL
jgi:hypothetical protein